MIRIRVIGVIAAAAFAAVSIAPGAMAQAAKPDAKAAAKPAPAKVAAKPAAKTVSGKIASIDAPLSMITLKDGKTYLIKDAAQFKKMKVGASVKLKIA